MTGARWWIIRREKLWLMWNLPDCEFKLVRAEGPCWKGELQIGRALLGWQSRERSR